MRLLGYVRVSSIGQADNTSIDSQIKEIRQYCKINNHSVEIIKDVASGSNLNREGYNELLNLLPFYDGIIAFKLDRLSRDTIDTLTLDRMIKKTNKQLIIINDGINASTSTLELTIRSVIAQEERKAISIRTRQGKLNKKNDGYYIGGQITLGKKRQVTDKGTILIDDRYENELIEIIRKHKRSGKGKTEIADYLNKNHYLTKNGKKFTYHTIHTILEKIKGK